MYGGEIMSEEIYKDSFVECLFDNLIASCGYTKTYTQIQVGVLVKNGVKTYWDLISHTSEWYENLKGLSKKTKEFVVFLKDHVVWHMEAEATLLTFIHYKYGLAHWRRIRKYFVEKVKKTFPNADPERVMFSWGQLSQVSHEDLLKTKGIGNATIRFLKDIQENKDEFTLRYEKNVEGYFMDLKKSGK